MNRPLDPGWGHTLRGEPARAQQEVLGVAILTGVVAVVALTVGAVVVANSTGGDPGPSTDLVVSVTDETVTLSHNGGDPVDLSALRVTLAGDGGETTFTPGPANATGSDARLDPGERIRRDHSLPPGDATATVVHRPSDAVLLEDRASIRRPSNV